MRKKYTLPKLNKRGKRTATGYAINRNGVPVCSNGRNLLKGDNFNYKY